MSKKKVTYRRIARDLGMDHGNLYHSLMNGANPEWKTVEKVLDYLGYDFRLIQRRESKSGKPNPQGPNELKKGGRFK